MLFCLIGVLISANPLSKLPLNPIPYPIVHIKSFQCMVSSSLIQNLSRIFLRCMQLLLHISRHIMSIDSMLWFAELKCLTLGFLSFSVPLRGSSATIHTQQLLFPSLPSLSPYLCLCQVQDFIVIVIVIHLNFKFKA